MLLRYYMYTGYIMSHSWLRIYIPQIHQVMDIRNRECCFHMVEYVKMSTSVM